MERLLSRDEFKRLVLGRKKGLCTFCSRQAVDAHHILERKLFEDGGYYLSNGAAVCEEHHWDCELTLITVEEVRAAAGIINPVLPPSFNSAKKYDKWGNVLREDGMREPGPLFKDTGTRKALAAGGRLGLFLLDGMT